MSGELFRITGNQIFTSFDDKGKGVILHDKKDRIDRVIARIMRNCIEIDVFDDKCEKKKVTVDKNSLADFLERRSAEVPPGTKLLGAYKAFLESRLGKEITVTSSFLEKLRMAGLSPPDGLVERVKKLHGKVTVSQEGLMDMLMATSSRKILLGPSKTDPPEVQPFLRAFSEHIARAERYKQTPLHMACRFGYLADVKRLITDGADTNAKNARKETPLHLACRYGNRELIKLLIDYGADVHRVDREKRSPLHWACQYGNGEAIEPLLAKGVDTTAALHTACNFRNAGVVKRLIENAADVSEVDELGQTPLHVACRYENKEVVMELIRGKADVNTLSTNGESAMHMACSRGGRMGAVVLLLLKAGAKVTEKDLEVARPLGFSTAVLNALKKAVRS